MIDADVRAAEQTLREHDASLDVLSKRVDGIATVVETIEPWVGAEGQLRVRLERAEQALLALIGDPMNPAASAERAKQILTSIPVPA